MRYRNDIDGLRSIAVLPILLFHAGLPQMPGGFIGVDIFFAISGFLITSIILREVTEGRFSIAIFYRRRIARIFPALFVMLAVTLVTAVLWMLPKELSSLARSTVAATIFGANIFFWRTSDYFDSAAESKPLLHTWSLGVEEQFYLFFPIIFLLVLRFAPRYLKTVIIALTAGSLLLCAMMTFKLPNAAFYLLPTRAWELGLGAMVATGCFPRLPSERSRGLTALAGMIMIVTGLFAIKPDSLFPVPWGILPCLGAAMLIAYGENSAIGRMLSLQPLRWIGHISYSLYLWHWPIITFYRLNTGFELDLLETLLLIAASIMAASLSYYLIEQPALSRLRSHGRTWPVLVGGGGAMAAVVAGCLFITKYGKDFDMHDAAVVHVESFADYRNRPEYKEQFRRGPCFRGVGDQFRPDICLKGDPHKPNMVVVGDSHAAQYWRALELRYPNRNVLQATASGCRPTLHAHGEERCTQVVNQVFNVMVPAGQIKSIVIAGRWEAKDVPLLVETVRYLRKKSITVVLIGPTLEYKAELPAMLARAMIQGQPDSVASLRHEAVGVLDKKMATIFGKEDVTYVSVYDLECPNGLCRLFAPDKGPMQFDYGHLTLSATRWLVEQMPAI